MQKMLLMVCLGFVLTSSTFAQDNEGFVPLFNGKNLDGWVNVNTAPSTWSVQDGMLICSGKPIGEIRTPRMYQNFILELEWRHMVPKGNAGVFIWADDITAKGQPFHRGIEVQVLENAYGKSDWFTTHGDIFPIHGAKMTPVNGRGGSRAFPTEERSKPSPAWNHYRIECVDGKISLAVNGKMVTQGTECWPKKGYICLESEGGVVHYRNLRIKELPDTPIDEADVAIANRGYRCLYSGVDLAGWKTDQTTTKWKSTDWVLSYSGENGQHDAIESTEVFQDYGFIFDVRLKENSEPAEVFLRGKNGGSIVIDPADAKLRDHLAEPGKWNRFEGTINANQLTLKLNDKVVWENQTLDSSDSSGSFRIEPNGAIDFANIYVRSLAN